MAIALHTFEDRTAGTCANMAEDLLVLEAYPRHEAIRFRHYGWSGPAATFGYSQKWQWAREQVDAGTELCRRPTGGGLTGHRSDWTYSLVIPPAHPFHRAPVAQVYKQIHQALAEALQALGLNCNLQPCKPQKGSHSAPAVCFKRAEIYDVIDRASGKKVAGAALKRNRHGVLLQGSVGVEPAYRQGLKAAFSGRLGSLFACDAQEQPWPVFPEELAGRMLMLMRSEGWNRRR